MCTPAEAERVTGYVVGGISPFGGRRRLGVIIDAAVRDHVTVYVSGGRRGLDICVAVDDLIRICAATVADIVA
jgi:Cys-tRNA(Pro)/Cys-tRNA(Cys) deacylase